MIASTSVSLCFATSQILFGTFAGAPASTLPGVDAHITQQALVAVADPAFDPSATDDTRALPFVLVGRDAAVSEALVDAATETAARAASGVWSFARVEMCVVGTLAPYVVSSADAEHPMSVVTVESVAVIVRPQQTIVSVGNQ